MYGQREQAIKLETLAEITLEEISRIETELTKIQTEESLH
jgi:capsule polysaccharide export protein KpsE/RkpR